MNNQEINQTEKLENTNIMPTNLQANSITPPNIIQTPSNNALEPIIPTQKAAEIINSFVDKIKENSDLEIEIEQPLTNQGGRFTIVLTNKK